jgi:phage tail sheath protein FI
MPEYLAPGVYVEEISVGTKPIEGVSTTTAAFVGIAEKGPLDKPTLVTSIMDYARTFGGYLKGSYLTYAVDGFFRNGGKRCYIVRVADADSAEKSKVTFLSRGGAKLFEVEAVNEGKWSNNYSVVLEAASTGSTSMFLTRLNGDHASGSNTLKLQSTMGLSSGSTLVITDGTNSETFDLVKPSSGQSVSLPTALANNYSADNTRVYTRWKSGSVAGTVKSATGFKKGSVILVESADPADVAVYATLTDVQQAARKLTWGTPLTANIEGAALVKLKRVSITMTLMSGYTLTGNKITRSHLDKPALFDRLEIGDSVTISSGTQVETRKINSISTGAAPEATLSTKLEYAYSGGACITASVTPKTKLCATKLAAGSTSTQLRLSDGIDGLIAGDQVTLGTGTNAEQVTISQATNSTTLVLTAPPSNNALLSAGVELICSFQSGDDHLIVESTKGLQTGDLIEVEAGGNSRVFRIDKIEENRVIYSGEPALPATTPITSASIEGVQWVATTVKSQEFKLVVEDDDGKVLEKFDKLSISSNSKRYFARDQVVNKVSTVIAVKDLRTTSGMASTGVNTLPALTTATLKGGADGTDTIEASDYIGTTTTGTSGKRTGLAALEEVDEVNTLCIPDVMMTFGGGGGTISEQDVEAVQLAMISHCETLKDRFAILDPITGQSVQQVQTWREDNLNSKYAALYYPWIAIQDPIKAEDGSVRFVPPSGHMAGVYARTDIERGVHKAPANELLKGVVRLERTITLGEQEVLNPDGVNCIRQFRGRGIRVWGARTVSSDSEWKYVNVRRLFLYLEESIEEGTQWVVFEPNDKPLWQRVIRSVSEFLERVWRDGALMGSTAEEAFFVKCDRTTMTEDDIKNGRMICMIGVAPVRPAEFVIFRIHQWQGGSETSE